MLCVLLTQVHNKSRTRLNCLDEFFVLLSAKLKSFYKYLLLLMHYDLRDERAWKCVLVVVTVKSGETKLHNHFWQGSAPLVASTIWAHRILVVEDNSYNYETPFWSHTPSSALTEFFVRNLQPQSSTHNFHFMRTAECYEDRKWWSFGANQKSLT